MKLKYVKKEDAYRGLKMLSARGVPSDMLAPVLTDYLKELNYQRSTEEGPPIFFKGAVAGAGRHISDKLLGVTAFTPGGGAGLDKYLTRASDFVAENWINPDWERQMEEVASGGLSPLHSEGRATWSAILGGQVPVMADLLMSKWLGKLAGTGIGSAVSAVAGTAAAPGAGTAAGGGGGAIVGSAIGSRALPIFSLSLNEAGSFLRTAHMGKVNPDVAEALAPFVGLASGIVEELQWEMGLAPFKALKKDAQKVAVKGAAAHLAKNPGIVKFFAKELGVNITEGLEEALQSGIQDVGLKLAYKAMRKRYGEDWEPAYMNDPSLVRDFVVGFGVSAVMRTGSRVVATPYAKRKRKAIIREGLMKEGQEFMEGTIEKGIPIDPETSTLSVRDPVEADYRSQISEGKITERSLDQENVDSRANLIDSLTPVGLRVLLSRVKNLQTPDGKPLKDQPLNVMRDLAFANWDVLHEGIQYVKNKKTGKLELEFVPVVSDYVPEGEKKFHRRMHRAVLHALNTVWASKTESDARLKLKEAEQKLKDSRANLLSIRTTLKSLESRLKQAKKDGTLPAANVNAELDALKVRMRQSVEAHAQVEAEHKATLKTIKPVMNYDSVQTAFWNMKRMALKAAGLSDAAIEYLNPIERSMSLKLNSEIDTKLTNTQHVRYVDSLEAQMRDMERQALGRRALAMNDAYLFTRWKAPTVVDANGKPITAQDVHADDIGDRSMPGWTTWFRRLSPFLGKWVDWQNKTGIRFQDMFYTLHNRYSDSQYTYQKLNAAWQSVMLKVPNAWVRGKGRRLYSEALSYLLMSNAERKSVSEQLGIDHISSRANPEGNIRALAEKLKKEMKLDVSADEIIKSLRETAVSARKILDYFTKSGLISWDMYREHYVPLMRKWADSGASMSFADFAEKEYSTEAKLAELNDDPEVAKKTLQEIQRMGDSIRAVTDRHVVPGEAIPFMQHRRQADLDMGKELGLIREMDFHHLLDIYFRQSLRKIYFDDVAPLVYTFISKMEQALPKGAPVDAFRADIADMLDAITGVPDGMSRQMNSVNLRSNNNVMGMLINTTFNQWNKHFGRKLEVPEHVSPLMALNALHTLMYSTLLGITPFNFNLMSPIKNIATQNVMAASLGWRNYIKGQAYLFAGLAGDPEAQDFIRELKALRLRIEFPAMHSEDFIGAGAMRQFAEASMALFKASDEMNVYSAAATALAAWKNLEPALKADPKRKRLTRSIVDKYLFSGQRPPINDAEVMAPENSIEMASTKGWKSSAPGAFRAMSFEVWDRIRRGDVEEAKRIYIQYAVNLSQWHYGPGGSPSGLRNPIIRSFSMFGMWPLNYGQWTATFLRKGSGLRRRWLSITLAQWLIGALFTLTGVSGWKWFLTGALPEEIGFMGPLKDIFDSIYGVLKSGGEAGQAIMSPASAKEKRQAVNAFKQRWETMWEPVTSRAETVKDVTSSF